MTQERGYFEFKAASGVGAHVIAFDGCSVTNFHTLSCRGTINDTYMGLSINSGATLPPSYQWNPNTSSASQTAQVVAYILMVLGKPR
jgi:hypothetical protein